MALTSLAIAIKAGVSGNVSKVDELSTLTDTISQTYDVTFAIGTGADQANGMFQDQRTLADGTGEELNFTDSSLTDKLSEAINFATLKALLIKNGSAAASLIIGNAVANQLGILGGATFTLEIQPGGTFLWLAPDATGLDVTTNATLKLLHDGVGGQDLVYDIIALGVQG